MFCTEFAARVRQGGPGPLGFRFQRFRGHGARPAAGATLSCDRGRRRVAGARTFLRRAVEPAVRRAPRRRSVLLSAWLLASWWPAAHPAHAETLVINTAFEAPISTPEQTGFFDRLMQEVMRRIGADVVVQRPPAERGLINANLGIDDGDGPRMPDLDTSHAYPNLRRVPESIMQVDFVAFTRDAPIRVTGWGELEPYDVGIVIGWKILETRIVRSRSLFKVRNADLLFGMLKNRRVDVVVVDRLTGLVTAERVGLSHARASYPPLARRSLYLYLNARHEALVPRIARALRAMKRDGTYERIRALSLSRYPAIAGEAGR